jgi:RNA polymerase sigma factor (sigma-70 family)
MLGLVTTCTAGKRGVNNLDLDHLRDLYARHRQGLFTLALSITRRRERAEDAVHEAFVKLCAPRRRSDEEAGDPSADCADEVMPCQPADPVAYVYRVVRFAAIDQVRRYWPGGNRTVVASDHEPSANGHGGMHGDGDGPSGTSVFDLASADLRVGSAGSPEQFDPAARTVDAETALFVARSLDRLPAEQRDAVVLRVYAGLTFEQIAAVVQAPLSTVAARYQRALARLRPCLEKLL